MVNHSSQAVFTPMFKFLLQSQYIQRLLSHLFKVLYLLTFFRVLMVTKVVKCGCLQFKILLQSQYILRLLSHPFKVVYLLTLHMQFKTLLTVGAPRQKSMLEGT